MRCEVSGADALVAHVERSEDLSAAARRRA